MITNWNSRGAGAAVLLLALTVGYASTSCRGRRDVDLRPQQGDLQARTATRQASGADIQPPDEWERRVDAWIRDVLLAGRFDQPIHRFVTPTTLEARGERAARFKVLSFDGNCRGLSPAEIAFMVSSGPMAIEKLIEHVRDERVTPWNFHFPTSSYNDMRQRMVGEIACYMIEAILRDNIYFTRTGDLLYGAPAGYSNAEQHRFALARAADAYETWYDRCFDSAREAIVCNPDDLPVVEWDYDLEAGPRYLRYKAKSKDTIDRGDPDPNE